MRLPSISTTAELLRTAYDDHTDNDWLVFEGTTVTYGELAERVDLIEAALVAVGVEPGDRVALYAENQVEWQVIQYAASSVGAIFMPINTRYGDRELERAVDLARPVVLFWGSEVYGKSTTPTLNELRQRLPGLDAYCMIVALGGGDDMADDVVPFDEFRSLDGIAALQARARKLEQTVDGHGPALMSFTSGTTGNPKAALLSHRGMILRMSMWSQRLGLRPEDCSILGSPLFWGFGCAMVSYMAPLVGSSTYMQRRFDAADFLAAASSFVTHLQGAPTQYELMLGAGDGEPDLSALRVIQYGGTGSNEDLVRRLRRAAPNASFVTTYGLTEGGFVNTWTDPDATEEDLAATIGRSGAGNTVVVMQLEEEVPCPPGEVGEICVSGPSTMLGYFARDDGESTRHSGWLRTGDLAVWDERQQMTVVGRLKDAFRSGGMNIYPEEIEETLLDHPAISFAAVFDIPDSRLGVVPAAVVVASGTTPQEIGAYIRDQVADYKRPRRIRIVADLDEVPMTPSGKLRKRDMRDDWQSWLGDETVVE